MLGEKFFDLLRILEDWKKLLNTRDSITAWLLLLGCAPELKTYGNKRQQKSASSLASKSLDSPMQLVQHSDATHSQSQSSVSEIDDLYSPLSNRTTLRGNRSNPVVKTTDVQKLSRSANRELDGIYHLETVPTNLSQRFSSFQKSTPERIIQLAYETSGNQSTSTTDTRKWHSLYFTWDDLHFQEWFLCLNQN